MASIARVLVALLVLGSTALAAPPVTIKYEEFTLPNGLRVIVHTDKKAPIVAVNLWYHVGSKDEPQGRSGFAHLFEHLMFQASENHKGEFFTPFELVGATNQNGTTNSDRTNYFQNVPTTALDMALWMESDRMGHLLGAIDQAALDEQRGVVQNEKRQGENQPYGRAFELLLAASYPEKHPYHHTTIGSMADLNAATLDDVKNWFKSWYGPNNAVLVLAGDIDVATAKEKVKKYFGDIAPTATVKKMPAQIAARAKTTRETVTDQVPQTRIYRVWNVPGYTSDDADRMDLFAHVLGGARSSRLDRRLLHTDKTVDNVSASVFASELGGIFFITADVKAGGDAAAVEKAIDEELQKLIAKGPTKEELAQARTYLEAEFIRGVERIGGFGGKADVLAECAVYTGKPNCYERKLKVMNNATPAQMQALAKKYLSKGDHILTINPGTRTPSVEKPAVANLPPTKIAPADKRLKTTPSDIDRTKGVPMPATFPSLVFPKLARATLSNGLKVVLAERRGLPLVSMSLEVQGAGFSSDPPAKPGFANFTMGMLDEGAGSYSALALGDKVESLGARLSVGAALDTANIFMSSTTQNLEPSLGVFADVLIRPTIDAAELERTRATWLASIKQEKARPTAIARRVGPGLLFGAGHPYAAPASGTEASISALKREDVVKWVKERLRPDRATLIVVGDTSLADLQPKLEKAFAEWKAPGPAAAVPAPPVVKLPLKPRVFLVDQPGAIQANIWLGHAIPSSKDKASIDFDIANAVLGGEFSSRLNMNLRENKHWAYGSYSFATSAVGQRIWQASANVQIDKTVESIKELDREIREFASGKAPAKPEEVTKIQSTEVRGLPGSYETAQAVLGTISSIVLYERPDDYAAQRATRISSMKPADVHAAAKGIKPDAATWVIVGDLSKIEKPIRDLKLGDVKVIDADGKVLR
jgi:predicted Zn-dependent peptidase